jgi:hypothetical protein
VRINASTTGAAGQWAKKALVDETLMRDVGDLALSIMRRRTAAGVDVNGAAFQALSPGYAKVKAKELGNARADLTVSGGMLNDMAIVSVSKNRVTLGFVSGAIGSVVRAVGGTFIQRSRAVPAANKAQYHNITGAGKSHVIRKFFGLNAREGDTIRARVQAYLARVSER